MAGNKNVRITTPPGEFVYPHMNSPDTKFVAEGEYHVKGRWTRDEAEALIEKLEEVRDTFHAAWVTEGKDAKENKQRAAYTIAEVFEEELDDDGEETGKVLIKAKMKAHVVSKRLGKEWDQAPRLFDSQNNAIDPDEVKIGGGTIGRLNCDVIPYAMASTKTVGVSLRLQAAQIIELRTFGGGSPFDEYDGGEVIEPSEEKMKNPFTDDDDDVDDY